MAPFEAPPARHATSHRRPSSAMRSAAMASASAAKRSASPPRRRPPNRHRSTNQYAYDDDDDLELPIVSSKPLSSADSIARFHRVRIVGVSDDVDVHTRRAEAKPAARPRSCSTSSTGSSASTVSARSSMASSSSSSSSSSGGPNPFTSKTRARAHQRPKYHAAASAKQIVRDNRLSSLVLHSVTPRDGASSASLSAATKSGSYTEYDVVVENVRTSQIWQVARRFSSFVQFRKELTALFATPHCHHCTAMHARLDALHDDFPAKRLWGSNAKSVTAQRARKLQTYLHGLLALTAKSHTKHCRLIASSFAMHVRGFLTVESTGFHGIPGGDLGHSIPSLLQELSRANTGAAVASAASAASAKRLPLATILENVPSQSIRASPWDDIALLEKDEDAETEDEEDASPSSDNQRDV